ncbi:phosphatidylglycerol lysyltransferase domain-containing protein [Curtobacterium sp. MCPF17_052]|nr:phosphatidylglycerol lysyltransferase domain-containing protein [Curtobacterium sp. MCPF17_052]WIB13138.1 phosphatidylglycerol lysyltransferase domain-containing protein [Curtobacterium sp. MCPF17_052]
MTAKGAPDTAAPEQPAAPPHEVGHPAAARVLRDVGRASRSVRHAVTRQPVTAVVLVLVLLASITAASLRFAQGRHVPDALVPFRVFAVTTGVLALVLTLAGVVVLVGASERLMGSRRTVSAFLATSVIGAAAAAVVGLVDPDGHRGAALLSGAEGLDPWTAILGTVTTASAFAGPLWRRRIRVNALAVVLTLFLYAGHTADLSAVVATAAGWGLGEVFRRTPKRTGWTRSSHRETRVLLGTVVLVSAVGPVIALVSRARVGLLAPLAAVVGMGPADQPSACRADGVAGECLHRLLTFRATDPWSLLLAIAPLLVLVVGAVGLFRGSRFAVWLVVVVDTVTGIAAAVTYTHVPGRVEQLRGSEDDVVVVLSIAASIAVPLLTGLVLLLLRRSFTVAVARSRVVTFSVTILVAAAVLATVVFVVADASPVRVHDPLGLVVAVLGPLSPVVHHRDLPIRDPGLRTVLGLVGPLLWAVVAVAAIRPAGATPGAADSDVSAADRERARALLVAGGGDTFGWMATWPGSAHWFSADGRAGVAYRRTGAVAVALGPFGWPDARGPALTEFARYCDDNGWTAVFHGIDTTSAAALTRLGWRTLPVAEDAAFDPRAWTTSGSRKQDVRTAVNKARRSGFTATWSSWQDLPVATTRQIEAISEEWVADRELPRDGLHARQPRRDAGPGRPDPRRAGRRGHGPRGHELVAVPPCGPRGRLDARRHAAPERRPERRDGVPGGLRCRGDARPGRRTTRPLRRAARPHARWRNHRGRRRDPARTRRRRPRAGLRVPVAAPVQAEVRPGTRTARPRLPGPGRAARHRRRGGPRLPARPVAPAGVGTGPRTQLSRRTGGPVHPPRRRVTPGGPSAHDGRGAGVSSVTRKRSGVGASPNRW